MRKKPDGESDNSPVKADKVLRPHVEVADPRLLLPRHLIAKAFSVSMDMVGKWDVKPVVQRGQERLFYLPEVVHYRGGSDGSPKLNPAQEKALLDKTRREAAQLELEKKRGRLVSLDDVEKVWESRLTLFRQRLIALPNKMARPMVEVDKPQEAEQLLATEIEKILEALNGESRTIADEIESTVVSRETSVEDPETGAEDDTAGVGGSV